MKKLKVLTIIGTRPEIIRLSEVLKELDRTMDHVLVHTGQNYDYELNEIFFKDLGLRAPDHFLEAAGATAIETVANTIARTDTVLATEQPDAVLVLGDTNSALGVYAAKRRKIPIFHMEAGNRCFDQRVPEEINRRIVDHTSDVNLVYSDRARQYLISEGFPQDRIIKTGSPMYEVLTAHRDAIAASNVLTEWNLEKGGYLVASFHREENVSDDKHFNAILDALSTLAETYKMPIYISTHPRTRKRIDESGRALPEALHFHPPLGLFDYVKLQQNAFCVLSDSGTISEESSILNFPAVTIREAHERPEAMDETAIIMSGLKSDHILGAVALATSYPSSDTRLFNLTPDYAVPNVSKKVARIILSYTDYVNRRVWMKD
jgi:UDP-N-acetyl-L-fucosamine synthase